MGIDPAMTPLFDPSTLTIKIFADAADKASVRRWGLSPWVKGFTTNPTSMSRLGVRDYHSFATELLDAIPDRPISFEVISDDMNQMEEEALEIASWSPQVYVKIPVMNTRGEPTYPLLRGLSTRGVKLNVTAVLPLDQVRDAAAALRGQTPAIISVFAGRVADTGRDPVPHMAAARELLRPYQGIELLWASSREVWNIFQAQNAGCDIITVTSDLLDKLPLIGHNLRNYSLETVKTFLADARRSGLAIRHRASRAS